MNEMKKLLLFINSFLLKILLSIRLLIKIIIGASVYEKKLLKLGEFPKKPKKEPSMFFCCPKKIFKIENKIIMTGKNMRAKDLLPKKSFTIKTKIHFLFIHYCLIYFSILYLPFI